MIPVTQQTITPSGTGAWVEVDVSAYIPATATGVALWVHNSGASSYAFGVRKNGSADDIRGDILAGFQEWFSIGVDASRKFKIYAGHASNLNITLIGYYPESVVFFDNAFEITPNADTPWEDTSIAALTGADTAIGAILLVKGGYFANQRKAGSTDNRTRAAGACTAEIVPIMSANNVPSPFVVSGQEEYNAAWLAFDNSQSTYWLMNTLAYGWLKIDCGTPYTVCKYSLQASQDANRCVKVWTFEGSNDNSTWDTLDSRSGEPSWSAYEWRTYEIASPAAYRYYRVNCTEDQGGPWFGLAGMQMYQAGGSIQNTVYQKIIGVSASEVMEQWIAAAGTQVYLVGYIKSGATFNTNATDISLGATGAWTDITLPGQAAGGVAIIEFYNTGSTVYKAGVRKNGSASTPYYNSSMGNSFMLVQIASDSKIEGEIENTNCDFFLVGWFAAKGDQTVTESITGADGTYTQFADIEDLLSGLDTAGGTFRVNKALAESLAIADLSRRGFTAALADSWAIADAQFLNYALAAIVLDNLNLAESITVPVAYQKLINQYINFIDTQRLAFTKKITDSFSVSETLKGILSYIAYDILVLRDLQSNQWHGHGGVVLADTLQAQDLSSAAKAFLETIADSLAGADSVATTVKRMVAISELLMLRDVWSKQYKGNVLLAEALLTGDQVTAEIALLFSIADSVAITDATKNAVGYLVKELINIAASAPNLLKHTERMTDYLSIGDIAILARVYLELVADAFASADSDALTRAIVDQIVERIQIAQTVATNLKTSKTLLESISLQDACFRGLDVLIADGLATSDTAAYLFTLALLMAETITLADATTAVGFMNLTLDTPLGMADLVTNAGKLNQLLSESVGFTLRIEVSGTVYQAWVLNTDEIYPSIYTGFDFNSYAEANGKMYAARRDGLYILEGEDDAGAKINTGVKLNFYNMGTHLKKRIATAHFGVSGNRPMLRITSEEGNVDYYFISGKIDAAKGHFGRQWVMELADAEALDFIEVIPLILTR